MVAWRMDVGASNSSGAAHVFAGLVAAKHLIAQTLTKVALMKYRHGDDVITTRVTTAVAAAAILATNAIFSTCVAIATDAM